MTLISVEPVGSESGPHSWSDPSSGLIPGRVRVRASFLVGFESRPHFWSGPSQGPDPDPPHGFQISVFAYYIGIIEVHVSYFWFTESCCGSSTSLSPRLRSSSIVFPPICGLLKKESN
jgi:hypothetical protein